jgi:phosphinothricin acetyltransferase
MAHEIRPMTAADWPACRAIYEQGIATRRATFETAAPDWEAWDGSHLQESRLVADNDGTVLGWAALSPVSDRCAYAGVGELSIYVAEVARGRGIGTALMSAVLAASEAAGIWTIQAGIFPMNEASLALAGKSGFRRVGVRERIGQLDGAWQDVILLERRSAVVGG